MDIDTSGTDHDTNSTDADDTDEVAGRERLRVTPALPRDDVVFLAGFGRHPVRDHGGAPLALPRRVGRIWPRQPPGPCPWVPCADGCCLRLAGRTGVVTAGAWLRFLLAEFLEKAHDVGGTVELPGHGRARAVLMVDASEVFEGEIESGLGRTGRLGDHEEPWSG